MGWKLDTQMEEYFFTGKVRSTSTTGNPAGISASKRWKSSMVLAISSPSTSPAVSRRMLVSSRSMFSLVLAMIS